ncbi:MAG: hypothetical protein ACRDD8_15920 [Bacteroidales bacterium]
MKCKCGCETFYEKIVSEYNIPARSDKESHVGYGMPYDYEDYFNDNYSEGFYCTECNTWCGDSLED